MAIDFNRVPSPCYVLDERLLEKNLGLIHSVKQKSGAEIILAFKGFAMWGVFPIIKKYIHSTTASSLNEARLAFEEFGNPAHTYAPVYTDTDFPEIINCSSHITFNSISQFEHFLPVVKKSGKKLSLGLRVNPEYSEVETELYNPCAPGSRLGVIASQLPSELPGEIEGLHFHTLCESKSYDLAKTLKAFENKFGKYFKQIKWVNMGGGHLMTHKDYDVEHLIALLKNFRQRTGLEVILEPGSAFAWETGYLVSTVIDVVENKGIKTAMLNLSFAAHMPDCLEMPYKPRIVGSYFEPVKDKPTYRMGGNSCLSGDYVGSWSFDRELKPGDCIVFEDMIHYTMVKTTFFNGVNHPSIGTWNDKNGFRLLREFGYEDFKNKLS
ncbi:MAG: carboxynorspermidine decarboxylase [Prolixibacteraceae bacterium]|nr:carboxynorspermidine decarboxylase [Prolixibacteraceae bacterium]